MASFNNQVVAPLVTKLVLPITGGSSSEPANKKQKEAHTRPPSASIDLRYAVEEVIRARGCTAATRRQTGHTALSQNSEKEGYQPDTSGGRVGPRDQGPRSHSSTGPEEKGEDASSRRSSEEDR